MRILHVIPSVGWHRGGASQAVIEMLQVLHTREINVELVTTNDNGTDLLDVPLCELTQYQQIPTWFFPRFSPQVSFVREFAFSWELTKWLWKNIGEYDLVHIHALFSYSSTVAMIIARLKRIPYINQPHGLLCEWSLQQSKLKKKIYLSLIERSNLQHSRILQLTSIKEIQEIAGLNLGVTPIVMPLGLEITPQIHNARQKLQEIFNISPEERIILFLSRLHYKKGLDYLIPALSKLKGQKFSFILAGNGSSEYEAEVSELLKTNNLEHCTHRPGFVTGEMKDILLQGSDIFVLTSHSENFGVAVLEAMAAGLATIVTPGVALASMIKENQVGYVPELDILEITKVIEHCLNHPEDAKATGDRARQFILDNYTWDTIAAKMVSVYKNIISDRTIKNAN
ncbi:glycosyltransferase [Nodularia harveyana UHCC-0300]|uniref:Glycosyltransferase n=1 Tax=Nodularia harveyana UHCC-0300 TaxID=2974287 RepID=A0ABU5UID6_9CYAN|nr:glycosyltransferase [Nodularia harveyana]MEA5583332.1 glycosyltransferase [Nodularia harveyana UHCC-0300]